MTTPERARGRRRPGVTDRRAPVADRPSTGSGLDLAFVIGAGFVVWGLFIGLGQISDNSFFTHLATGRLILAGRHPAPRPLLVHRRRRAVGGAELAGVVALRLDRQLVRARGPPGADGADHRRCSRRMTWALTRPAKGLVGRIVITGLVLAVGTSVWAPRPLLIGLLLLGLTLLVAEGRVPPPVLLPAL